MENSTHTLTELFDQLGLESSPDAITQFVQAHPLAPGITLQKAAFWSEAQQHFIQESWHEDSDWAELIDQLDNLLRR
jgi:hypothetical protein